MFDEFGKEDDQWRPDEAKAVKIIKKVLAWGFTAFAFLFIGFLVLRMFMSNPPSKMERVVWNEPLLAAYNESAAKGEKLEILQIPTSNAFSEEGMFSLYTVTYAPSIKQLQFTVRYNNRIMNYLVKDYPEADKITGEVYTFSLEVKRGEGTELLTGYTYTAQERFGYTYRRLIFENVELEGVTNATVNVAYVGAPNQVRHSISVYNNTVHKAVNLLPDFSYSKPKGITKEIKTKEST